MKTEREKKKKERKIGSDSAGETVKKRKKVQIKHGMIRS